MRFTPNGKAVVTFSLYTRERWTSSSGEARDKTQRHQITAWGAQAELAQWRLEKGTRVQVVGRIDQQSWGEGEQRQYKTVLVASEIVLLSLAAAEQAPAAEQEASAAETVAADQPAQQPAADTPAKPQPRRRRKAMLYNHTWHCRNAKARSGSRSSQPSIVERGAGQRRRQYDHVPSGDFAAHGQAEPCIHTVDAATPHIAGNFLGKDNSISTSLIS